MDSWELKNTLDWHSSWRDAEDPDNKREYLKLVLELLRHKENKRTCIRIDGQIDETTEWHHCATCGVLFLKMNTPGYETRHYAFDEMKGNTAEDVSWLCQRSEIAEGEGNNSFQKFIEQYLTTNRVKQTYHIQLLVKNTS